MTPLPAAASAPAARGQFVAEVIENANLCREHFRLVLRVADFPVTEPGQFIQISCREPDAADAESFEIDHEWVPGRSLDDPNRELVGPLALLRRPFSLAGRRDTPRGVELDIIHRVVGVGTDWLSRLRVGDGVSILGPLGNRFTLPKPDQMAILVGGGVGIPPMLYLAAKLAGRRAAAFCGALSRDLLPLTLTRDAAGNPNDFRPMEIVAEFSRHGIPTTITTDDGSFGFRGFVTQALERYLDSLSTQDSALSTLIYTCGPEPMMKRVADIALARGIECQIAVERAMACGMGTCQSCCIRVRKPDPAQPPLPGSDWCYRLACTDGPIFAAADLLW
jgi:dihydroorotate dehydrogenase electron transfer subunit